MQVNTFQGPVPHGAHTLDVGLQFAAVGALVDSTFGGGGTAVEGHKLSGAYQLAKNIKVGLNYMMAERTRSETTDHDVLQFEVNFKF